MLALRMRAHAMRATHGIHVYAAVVAAAAAAAARDNSVFVDLGYGKSSSPIAQSAIVAVLFQVCASIRRTS